MLEILGTIVDIEVIASGREIRERRRLHKYYGRGRWRKCKGIARIRLMAASTRRKSTGTKRTASAAGSTRSSGSSRDAARRFVVCLSNAEAPASLEVHKIYSTLLDPGALKLGLLRVVDESGEDYLYPSEHFSVIKLPPKLAKAIGSKAG